MPQFKIFLQKALNKIADGISTTVKNVPRILYYRDVHDIDNRYSPLSIKIYEMDPLDDQIILKLKDNTTGKIVTKKYTLSEETEAEE